MNCVTSRILNEIEQAIKLNLPVIIQGDAGSGKSFLIRKLAVKYNKMETLVEMNFDDRTDSKSILGAYSCSDIPGEFVWEYGIISKAALLGHWLVIENIDQLNLDLLSTLCCIMEKGAVPSPDRGPHASSKIHPNFRIFGTRTLSVARFLCNFFISIF
jgi:midasin